MDDSVLSLSRQLTEQHWKIAELQLSTCKSDCILVCQDFSPVRNGRREITNYFLYRNGTRLVQKKIIQKSSDT